MTRGQEMGHDESVSAAECDALFAAILIHDDIHLDATLPNRIASDYDDEQIARCFGLCLQLWDDGIDRRSLQRVVERLARRRPHDPDDERDFKHARARFKQLRFGYVIFSRTHRYPFTLQQLTIAMGQMQDALRNDFGNTAFIYALLLRSLLTPPLFALARRAARQFQPTTAAGLHAYVRKDLGTVSACLARTEVSGEEFHACRKVISRQVALYDCLRVLDPLSDYARVSRYLGTINGMMGKFHDGLVRLKLREPVEYRSASFPIPEAIHTRLQSFVDRHVDAPSERTVRG